jgi:hypothetical protein
LNEGIKKLDREIESKGKHLKGYNNITSIKGIGPKSGTILLSVIGDIDRNSLFAVSEEFLFVVKS